MVRGLHAEFFCLPRLTADQIKELVPLFKEWDTYAASYPAPRGRRMGLS
jgi:hypothetical protein